MDQVVMVPESYMATMGGAEWWQPLDHGYHNPCNPAFSAPARPQGLNICPQVYPCLLSDSLSGWTCKTKSFTVFCCHVFFLKYWYKKTSGLSRVLGS